jgi:hypothetical protein
MALYRAKSDGRTTYRFFERDMDAQMQARRGLELDLRRAIDDNQFELFYQPQFNLETNAISGFEALIRWFHPTRGLVHPQEFIPLAEENMQLHPISAFSPSTTGPVFPWTTQFLERITSFPMTTPSSPAPLASSSTLSSRDTRSPREIFAGCRSTRPRP